MYVSAYFFPFCVALHYPHTLIPITIVLNWNHFAFVRIRFQRSMNRTDTAMTMVTADDSTNTNVNLPYVSDALSSSLVTDSMYITVPWQNDIYTHTHTHWLTLCIQNYIFRRLFVGLRECAVFAVLYYKCQMERKRRKKLKYFYSLVNIFSKEKKIITKMKTKSYKCHLAPRRWNNSDFVEGSENATISSELFRCHGGGVIVIPHNFPSQPNKKMPSIKKY